MMLASLFLAGALAQATASPSPSPSPSPAATQSPAAPASPLPARRAESKYLTLPPAWRKEKPPSAMRGFLPLEAWTSPGENGEAIVVGTQPNYGQDLHTIVTSLQRGMTKEHAKLVSSKALQLCNGKAGWIARFEDSGGVGLTYVLGLTASRAYLVMFAYPGYPGPSSDGEAAVESLCAPADPIVRAVPPFAPPSGWKAQPAMSWNQQGSGQMYGWNYTPPSGGISTQGITVIQAPMPPGGGLSFAFAALVRYQYDGKAQVTARRPIQLCGQYDGVYLEMNAQYGLKHRVVESVMTAVKHTGYVATYWRDVTAAKDPKAEAAIRTLCPK